MSIYSKLILADGQDECPDNPRNFPKKSASYNVSPIIYFRQSYFLIDKELGLRNYPIT